MRQIKVLKKSGVLPASLQPIVREFRPMVRRSALRATANVGPAGDLVESTLLTARRRSDYGETCTDIGLALYETTQVWNGLQGEVQQSQYEFLLEYFGVALNEYAIANGVPIATAWERLKVNLPVFQAIDTWSGTLEAGYLLEKLTAHRYR